MNYTTGSYATFASIMALQPPFANLQTNVAADTCASQPAPAVFPSRMVFPRPMRVGNYALDPHYRLPYVQVWNVDIQKTLPWGIVMNAGYNGSKGSNLDVTIAPRATENSPLTNPDNVLFNYEQARAFSNFNAGTLRVNKRLSNGVALGANYQYSHAIDNAGSEGGTSTVVAQNWQDILAEEGNSSFDVRHKVSGNYLFELPFGKDKFWFTTGKSSHILEGFSISGTFTFATGTSLTPVIRQLSMMSRAAPPARGAPIAFPALLLRRAAARCITGSTQPHSPRPLPTRSAMHMARPRATPFPVPESCKTTCLCQKQCNWAKRAASNSAPPPTTSSTRSSIPAWPQRCLPALDPRNTTPSAR